MTTVPIRAATMPSPQAHTASTADSAARPAHPPREQTFHSTEPLADEHGTAIGSVEVTRVVRYTAAGEPTAITTTTVQRTNGKTADGDPVTVTDHGVSVIDARGKPITFDHATGRVLEPRAEVDRKVTTKITQQGKGLDDHHDAMLTFVQYGSGYDTDIRWTSLEQTVERHGGDNHRTRNVYDYTFDQLDADGWPKSDDVEPHERTDLAVDNRDFWEKHDPLRMLGTGLSIVGGILCLLPTGVTQVVGGAMLVAGSGIAAWQDIPDLLAHPSLMGTFAVGMDVVGAIAGVGGVAAGAIRAAGAVAEAPLWATRTYDVTNTLLNSRAVVGAGYAALGAQGIDIAHKALMGEYHDLDDFVEDGIGLLGTGVTIGVAHAVAHAEGVNASRAAGTPPGVARSVERPRPSARLLRALPKGRVRVPYARPAAPDGPTVTSPAFDTEFAQLATG